ncbi:unnamed protein product [Owenia fusiformis]|uniref:HAUS augmin-like complex subunit 8 n=1 Tax=Owenia fusiformis TaxID=6347 RepID=A0A8S4NRJ1_OWEFU|nr:unnamed protein product [Owenia fusiformis]
MASKRSLYKPAPEQSGGNHSHRRPLAQGRLISNISNNGESILSNTHDSGAMDLTTYSTKGHDVSLTMQHSPFDNSSHNAQSPRQRLTRLISGDSAIGDQTATPRRNSPSVTQPYSPRKEDPTHSLEVSDLENELSYSQMKSRLSKSHSPANVMVVDASRRTISPDKSEVDIVTGYEHSPVKVVCHTPGVVQSTESSLRNSGSVQAASTVAVDHPPSSIILSGTDITDPSLKKPPDRFKSPMVVRESTIAGSSNVDPSSLSKSVNVAHTNDKLEETTLQHRQPQQPKRIIGDGKKLSPTENQESVTGYTSHRPKIMSKTMDTSHDKKKRRKMKGTVIPSRFKQSAETVKIAGTSKMTDKSSLELTTNLRASRLDSSGPKRPGSARKKPAASEFHATPMVRGSSQVGGKTSTPTANVSLFPGQDVSAIVPDNLSLLPNTSQDISHIERPASHKKVASKTLARTKQRDISQSRPREAIESHSQGTPKKSAPKGASMEVVQQHLDVTYARYLQMLYLDSKAKKVFQEQEKEVMAQLYALWEEVEALRRKDTSLDIELTKLKHSNALDEQLEIQQSGLGPVTATIPKLRQEYGTLAQALDTTRHQIPLRGIQVPDNEEAFDEMLLSSLNESEQLLGELSVMHREKQPKVTTFANTLSALQKSVEEEDKELKRLTELLSAAKTLSTRESSLKIQHFQNEI